MTNPIACTTGGYPGESLARVLQGIATAGFRAVELSATSSPHSRIKPEHMDATAVAALGQACADYGLTPISISGHADLTTAAGVAQFQARLALAAALGVTIVNTGTGHSDSAEDADRFFALMQAEVLPVAAGHGVKVALETHGGLTGTADDCLRTLERLDSPWVGINYDPANVLYYRGVRPETDIAKIAPHVIHVHMKDQRGGQGVDDFPPLGEGEIDFGAIVQRLAQVNYRGPYSVELEVKNIANPEAEDRMRLRCREFLAQFIT